MLDSKCANDTLTRAVWILVAQRQAEHALLNQIQQRVLDLPGAAVGEAGGEPPHDSRLM
jgi:hypothetical protein